MPSTPGLSGQLFDTMGFEVEGTLMQRDEMQGTVLPKLQRLMGPMYNKVFLDRDASTESFAETFRLAGRPRAINAHTSAYHRLSLRGGGESRVYGYEFKTSPLEMQEIEPVLYPLMWTLYEHGDVVSDRASIHMHVGFANNFRMLHSLLTIMLSLEPVMYRLGGMGGTFRGHLNNAAYCRPLLNSCVVPIAKLAPKRTYAQILNPVAARDAKNLDMFWAHMGVNYDSPSQHKYHASRYVGSNFFALYSHGTYEWRYFNKSFDVPLVIAIAKLMRAVVETSSMCLPKDVSKFDVIDSCQEISVGDAERVLGMTVALCHEKGMENMPTDSEMAHILEVLRQSHFVPLPETPTTCHIADFMVNDALVQKGNLRLFEEVFQTSAVTVHNIQDKIMSIYA